MGAYLNRKDTGSILQQIRALNQVGSALVGSHTHILEDKGTYNSMVRC